MRIRVPKTVSARMMAFYITRGPGAFCGKFANVLNVIFKNTDQAAQFEAWLNNARILWKNGQPIPNIHHLHVNRRYRQKLELYLLEASMADI